MRTFSSLVALVALALGGIGFAQTMTVEEPLERVRPALGGPTCSTPNDETYRPDAVVQWDGQSYRCAYIYDSWMTRTSRVTWVKATP